MLGTVACAAGPSAAESGVAGIDEVADRGLAAPFIPPVGCNAGVDEADSDGVGCICNLCEVGRWAYCAC